MIIAINTIGFQTQIADFDFCFFEELLFFAALQQPNDTFIFITNKPINNHETLPKNCSVEIVKANPNILLGLSFFRKIILPLLLKKLRPQIVLDIAGYGNIATKIPQVIIAKQHTRKALQKAYQVLAASQFEKEQLIKKFQILNPIAFGSKFQIITAAANPIFTALNYVESSIAKDGYSDGRDYFLSVANHYSYNEFIYLLKAFSLFKRWQKSSMKLLVLGTISDHKNLLTEKITTYKYREDVALLSIVTIEQQAKLFGAAYGIISLANESAFALPILQALQSCVPVITSDTADLKEHFGDTILYIQGNDFEELANHMKLLYRDENQRNQLITKGSQLVANFSYQNSANVLWSSICAAI